MFHVFSDEEIERFSNIASCNCEPLYLSSLNSGGEHSALVDNATLTYVQYDGDLYGITCGHVIDQQFDEHGVMKSVLRVIGDGTSYDFIKNDGDGNKSSFHRIVRDFPVGGFMDVAIAKLPEYFRDLHMVHKRKVPIILDKWESPDWENVKTAWVCGFPTERKRDDGAYVVASPLQVVAEFSEKFDENRESFLLASTIEMKENFYLSGMSGGPVYLTTKEISLLYIGILFEGSPGSSDAWKNRSEEAFTKLNDIRLRCYFLTPDIFSRWVMCLKF